MTMKYPSLDRLLESIGSVFDAYSVVLFCRNSGGTFDLTSSFSLGNSIRKGLTIEQGQGLVGWILKNDSPLVVEKFDEKNTFLGYYGSEQDEQIKVFVGCPLPGGAGALCMDSKKTYAFTSKDQRVLSLFAGVVAAIMNDVGEGGVSSREQALYRVLQQVYALREEHPKWTDFLNRYLALLAGASGYEYAFLVVSDEWGNNYLLEGSNKPFMPKPFPPGRLSARAAAFWAGFSRRISRSFSVTARASWAARPFLAATFPALSSIPSWPFRSRCTPAVAASWSSGTAKAGSSAARFGSSRTWRRIIWLFFWRICI